MEGDGNLTLGVKLSANGLSSYLNAFSASSVLGDVMDVHILNTNLRVSSGIAHCFSQLILFFLTSELCYCAAAFSQILTRK